MKFFKNKILLGFAFAAAVFFVSISLGGDVLHGHIHHHSSQTESNDCPVYQLAAQWLLSGITYAFVVPVVFHQIFVSIRDRFPFEAWRLIVNPRAPPSAHI
jgi:hypothetical protein